MEKVRRTLADIVPIVIATTVSGCDWGWQGTLRTVLGRRRYVILVSVIEMSGHANVGDEL